MSARKSTSPTAGALRRVRMENRTASAEKLYEVCVEADPAVPGSFRCRAVWGRISASHRSEQVKEQGSAAACERALEALVREKRGRGYQVVEDQRGDPAVPPVGSPSGTPTTEPATEQEGLARLLARRKREASWAF